MATKAAIFLRPFSLPGSDGGSEERKEAERESSFERGDLICCHLENKRREEGGLNADAPLSCLLARGGLDIQCGEGGCKEKSDFSSASGEEKKSKAGRRRRKIAQNMYVAFQQKRKRGNEEAEVTLPREE